MVEWKKKRESAIVTKQTRECKSKGGKEQKGGKGGERKTRGKGGKERGGEKEEQGIGGAGGKSARARQTCLINDS